MSELTDVVPMPVLPCEYPLCEAHATATVRGMIGGDINDHRYCERHATAYSNISRALGTPVIIAPIELS